MLGDPRRLNARGEGNRDNYVFTCAIFCLAKYGVYTERKSCLHLTSKFGATLEKDTFLTWFLQIILNPESEEVKIVKLDF